MIGVRLGPWLIDSELGRGGMGAVYHAQYIGHHLGYGNGEAGAGKDHATEAAVKVLAAELALEAGFRQRFEREILILEQLQHPHIVRFFESGEQSGRYFYVMEYVAGPNYEDLLEKSGKLPWRDVLEMALQIVPALKHAHDRGIVHRDLKPSNLLRSPLDLASLDGPAVVKLADFGIASLFASPHLTLTGGVIGTPEYLSPEQASGKQVTPRSDLYALGVVIYQLLTGRTPFEGDAPSLLHAHRFGQFEKPSRLVPELPHDLEEVICQLLEKDPANRPADAGVLARRLDSVRRKLERRSSGNTGRTVADTAEAREAKVGPATLMSRLMRRTLQEESEGGGLRRWLNNPLVLVVLFLVTLVLIVWGLWPVSPEALFQRGAALMSSSDPTDWERAWERYLGKLEEKYPKHNHKEEVAVFRKKYEAQRLERKAENAARLARAQGEAEWFFHEGLRLRRHGDEPGARRVWERLIAGFGEVPAERPWVRRAEKELSSPPPSPETREQQWEGLRGALRGAAVLEKEGRQEEARKIREALRALYEGDSEARKVLEEKIEP